MDVIGLDCAIGGPPRLDDQEAAMKLLLATISIAVLPTLAMVNLPVAAREWIDTSSTLASDEPFVSTSIDASENSLSQKWHLAWAEISSEIAVLSECNAQSDRCSSPAAIRLLKILERARAYDGFAKLAIINSGVNAAIRYASGVPQHGIGDPWPAALAAFALQRGVCTDFAIAKYTALLQAGWPLSDVRLVLVWPYGAGESHMILAARHNDQWLILDSARSAILPDTKLRNYVPLFVLDHLGVRQLFPQFVGAQSRLQDRRISVMTNH
jgi:predicted transglutaminase-like cysteine proteinase